jgi:hypothetical protein
MQGRIGGALLATLLLIIGGCIGPLTRLRSADPEDAWSVVNDYGTDLRWGRIAEAAGSVHPDQRTAFHKLLAGHEERIRMTEFEVESVNLLPDQESAEAIVSFRLYRLPTVVEEPRREVIRMRWERAQDRWYVEPDLMLLAINLGLEPVGSGP